MTAGSAASPGVPAGPVPLAHEDLHGRRVDPAGGHGLGARPRPLLRAVDHAQQGPGRYVIIGPPRQTVPCARSASRSSGSYPSSARISTCARRRRRRRPDGRGRRSERKRQPHLADRAQDGCSRSTVIPRACACGDANAAGMSLMGRRDLRGVEDRLPPPRCGASAGARPARDAAGPDSRPGRRCRVPRSAARDPRSSASHRRGHCRSLPTAIASSPSRVAKVSYGTIVGWALPRRPGALSATRRSGPGSRAVRGWNRAGTRRSAGLRPHAPPAGRARGARPAPRPRRTGPVTTSLIATPNLRRPAAIGIGGTRDRHQAADRLDHEVVARLPRPARRARSRRRRDGRVRVDRGSSSSSRPSRARRRRGVLHQHVRAASRRRRTWRPASWRRSSRIDRLLRIHGQYTPPSACRRLRTDPRRPPAPRRVAVGGST